jgi:hypothetical protein
MVAEVNDTGDNGLNLKTLTCRKPDLLSKILLH